MRNRQKETQTSNTTKRTATTSKPTDAKGNTPKRSATTSKPTDEDAARMLVYDKIIKSAAWQSFEKEARPLIEEQKAAYARSAAAAKAAAKRAGALIQEAVQQELTEFLALETKFLNLEPIIQRERTDTRTIIRERLEATTREEQEKNRDVQNKRTALEALAHKGQTKYKAMEYSVQEMTAKQSTNGEGAANAALVVHDPHTQEQKVHGQLEEHVKASIPVEKDLPEAMEQERAEVLDLKSTT